MLNLFRPSRQVAERVVERATPMRPGALQVTLKTTGIERAQTGMLVLATFPDGALPDASSRRINLRSNDRLASVISMGDLGEAAGSTLLLYDVPGIQAHRLLLVSLGPSATFGDRAFRQAVQGAAKVLASSRAEDAIVALTNVEVPGRSLSWRLQTASRLLAEATYRFSLPSTESPGTAETGSGVRRMELYAPGTPTPELEEAIRRGLAIGEGMALAKDLGNLPGNICTPLYLADTARELGTTFHFHVDVLEREDMRRLGMGAALAVGQASAHPCKFIVMHYRGADTDAPIVLVGKGVTFDTGGISLKPGANMDEMKFDMCGAASVLGTMKTVARLALPINLVGIIPAVENMPGGNATRPGDIVRSMSGQTIEILNTDAEGRLALADALTYAERFRPACVIDVATLTGACVIALGHITSGLLANNDRLANELLDAGADAGDRAWRLPLFDEYEDQLKSNFADMSNLGGRPAGAITAASFLSRFARQYPWAHLDIAGTNALSGDSKGATGRPVPLLAEFLINRAAASRRPVA